MKLHRSLVIRATLLAGLFAQAFGGIIPTSTVFAQDTSQSPPRTSGAGGSNSIEQSAGAPNSHYA